MSFDSVINTWLNLISLPGGRTDPATLVAARLAGVTEVYRCGGAQAVAAVAYGTATVPRVVKMVGPGSPYLVAAKKLLSHRIDPGILAGPSESIILADETADGRLAALDLLIEAEHGPDSSCFLVTNSRAVAEAVIKGDVELLRSGQQAEVSVLFADIRGFTRMAEAEDPKETVAMLNQFFSAMADVVFEHGGNLDKFIGDCVMAVWGPPQSHPDDPARAVTAALQMQEVVNGLNARRLADGRRPIEVGIGVNTGSAIVGGARGDIFFGSGDAAGAIAGAMRAHGRFVVLAPGGATA